MKPDARDLFSRAQPLDPDAREAFLAGECGDNAELRLEVQRMLVDSEKADAFFADDEGATIGATALGDTFTEAEVLDWLLRAAAVLATVPLSGDWRVRIFFR